MVKPILSLNNAANWNLVYEQNLEAQIISGNIFYPISKQNFTCNTNIILINCTSFEAKPTWSMGATISINLELTVPLTGLIEIFSKKIKVNNLNFITWIPYEPKPYTVYVEIPYYFKQVYFKVYEYIGIISDYYEQLLTEINAKI